MNLYHLTRLEAPNYDEYIEAIVAANTIDEAKYMHPDGVRKWVESKRVWATPRDIEQGDYYDNGSWPPPDQIDVTLIGVSNNTNPYVVIASFRAG